MIHRLDSRVLPMNSVNVVTLGCILPQKRTRGEEKHSVERCKGSICERVFLRIQEIEFHFFKVRLFIKMVPQNFLGTGHIFPFVVVCPCTCDGEKSQFTLSQNSLKRSHQIFLYIPRASTRERETGLAHTSRIWFLRKL